jgi:hypothetical protein
LARIGVLGWCLLVAACSGSDGAGDHGSNVDGGSDGDSASPAAASYCDGQLNLLELPRDPAEPGPWKVGSRGIAAAGLDAEVWYPAAPGSADGLAPFTYDLRKYLPPEQQATVTDSTTIREPCDCYRDLPIDASHGPYPVIVFLHGFSGFSAQSVVQMTHWASRGFVVVAADHPSLGLKTLLTGGIGALDLSALGGSSCDLASAGTQSREAVGMLDALHAPSGDLAFLEGRIDMTRVGAAGHSAGAFGSSVLSGYENVRVIVPMAGGGVCGSASLESSLVIGGMVDAIVTYDRQQGGFGTTPPPKRLLGLDRAGHMAFTAFCPIGESQGGILAAAMNAGVTFDPAFLALVGPLAADGCGSENLSAERGWEVTNFATAAVFEETLLCLPERAGELARIRDLYADAVGDFQEAL